MYLGGLTVVMVARLDPGAELDFDQPVLCEV